MSTLNTSPRKFHTKTTFRTVVHPDYDPRSSEGITRNDYIEVPRLSTQGEWPISYMLPDEQLVHLAVMANHLKPKSQHAAYSERFEEKRKARVAEGKAAKQGGRHGA